jgi:hypothetical protein
LAADFNRYAVCANYLTKVELDSMEVLLSTLSRIPNKIIFPLIILVIFPTIHRFNGFDIAGLTDGFPSDDAAEYQKSMLAVAKDLKSQVLLRE